MPATLQPLPVDSLCLDAPLPWAIQDANGKVLIPAGHRLTADNLAQLQYEAAGPFFIEEDATVVAADGSSAVVADPDTVPTHRTDLTPLHVNQLEPGMPLAAPLYDAEGRLLLAPPSVVDEHFLHLLQLHCTRFVFLKGETSSDNDRKNNGLDEVKLWNTARELLSEHLEASNTVMDVCAAAFNGGQADMKSVRGTVERFYGHCSGDRDLLLAIVSLQHCDCDHLCDHSVNVSMVAMSLATRLGLSEDVVQEIGLAGLLQDIGMLSIPEEVRLATREITPAERLLIARHPLITVKCLNKLGDIGHRLKTAVLQAHERLDGSGYPQGLAGSQIALSARVLAIADVYCAMISPRPYRHALLPYIALRDLLLGAHAGQFDRQVLRVFLNMQSAFGVGSLVELNDGRIMRVLRAIPHEHTRPYVVSVDSDGNPQQDVINLSRTPDLFITRVLADEPPPA